MSLEDAEEHFPEYDGKLFVLILAHKNNLL